MATMYLVSVPGKKLMATFFSLLAVVVKDIFHFVVKIIVQKTKSRHHSWRIHVCTDSNLRSAK